MNLILCLSDIAARRGAACITRTNTTRRSNDTKLRLRWTQSWSGIAAGSEHKPLIRHKSAMPDGIFRRVPRSAVPRFSCFKTLVISTTLLLATSRGFSQAPPKRADVVDGELARNLDTQLTQAVEKGFGGAVIVEVQGKSVLKAGYGLADRETRVPFTAETIAQIGSITKPLTALAVLQLADQGKVDLSAPVGTYLPGAAQPAANATLHQLLTHHAGLADSCGNDFAKVSKADLLHRCMAMPLAHPPNQENYSNMGYSILAAVVEQVSGQFWENYLRAHIFEPLAMSHTGFAFTGADSREFAAGYMNGKRQAVISDRLAELGGEDWNLRGNGGIQSSATDMERFYRGISGRAPGISHAVVQQMITPHEQIEGEAWEGYGLAVRLDVNNKVYRIGHSGSDGVFFSYFGWLPQQDIFIYIVGNNGEAAVKPIVGLVVKAIQNAAGVKPQGDAPPSRPMEAIVRPLDSTKKLVPYGVSLEVMTHAGRKAVRLLNKPPLGAYTMAVVQGADFQDGTIHVDVASEPAAGASTAARGFIGIAFRVGSDPAEYECLYLRPTNGRADDQLRRNHSTQYISAPKFQFDRLRREAPGVYESYVDLVPGAWTHIRIDVQGQSAKLFVDGATQPSLIVNDLKHPARSGPVALWIGDETEGYFSNLRIEPVR